MKKIEAKTNFTGKSASVNLDVPSGSNRTFTVEVTDKNKIVLYTGGITQSLNPGTPVTVQIPMNRTKVPVTVEVTPSGPMPIGAYTVNIIVTGEGMEEMKSETTFTEKNAIINFPAIPSGPDRKFAVEVKDEKGEILYIGITTQSLSSGKPVTISIPTNRVMVPVTIKVTSAEIQQGASYTLTISVTGEGMNKMEAQTIFTGKGSEINRDIPSGSSRIFIAEVKDKNGIILYSGTATQSLSPGKQTTVSIPIIRIQPEVIPEVIEAKMVLIPAGEFEMGTAESEIDQLVRDFASVGVQRSWFEDEVPRHTVYLDAYYIDVYEVTNAQYAKFLNEYGKNIDAVGHELLDIDSSYIDSSYCLIEKVGNTYKPKSGYENHPVIAVTWYGAAAYAQFYGKRLPTEAEWEKAARGGLVGKRYPWGDNITHDDANYDGTGGKDQWSGTSPVGSFAPNGYGLYDLAGNVWEWCADEYASDYYSKSPKNNPKGPGVAITFKNNDFTNVTTRRALRGGTWYDPLDLRCANRYYDEPSSTYYYRLGFRCSQDR
jgi:formylglycine-generating enzyme required for sulfatase activity